MIFDSKINDISKCQLDILYKTCNRSCMALMAGNNLDVLA